MELLSPAERVAFMLHDVFGQPFDEIADVLDRSPDAVRQLASRARRRVRGAPEPLRSERKQERRVVDAWLAAVEGGDLSALLELLDGGAVLYADLGATKQTVVGADAIIEQAQLASRLAAGSVLVRIDGDPGVAAVLHGRVASLMLFELAGDRIVGLEVLADPARLAGLRLQ